MVIIGSIAFVLILLFACGCMLKPNEYDKEQEDKEQIEYLKEWNRKRYCK